MSPLYWKNGQEFNSDLDEFKSEMNQRGFVAWNGPVHQVISGGTALANQKLYVYRVPVLQKVTVTNIAVIVSTIVNTPTSGQNLLTLYEQDGTKLGDSADLGTAFGTAGLLIAPITGGPFEIDGTPTGYVWVSVLSNASTGVKLAENTSNASAMNAGGTGLLGGADLWSGVNGTAVTATDDLTPASNSRTAALDAWIGLS